MNEKIYKTLVDKHPPNKDNINFIKNNDNAPQISIIKEKTKDIVTAIHSFPKLKSGGKDGFKPQFLKDMLFVHDIDLKDRFMEKIRKAVGISRFSNS